MGDRNIELIKLAQNGDQNAKEQIIRDYRSFVKDIASNYCGRELEWENDDELSVALLAINEAIDNYDINSDKKFKNYIRMILKSRLIDYFRKETRHNHLSLDIEESYQYNEEYSGSVVKLEAEASWKQYQQQEERAERAEEMQQFDSILQEYGLSLTKVEQSAPKHSNTRDKLVETAKLIAKSDNFLEYLRDKKKLPLKELVLASGVSKKTLKRGRQYIIAVVLIITEPSFSYLRNLFDLPSDV